MRSYFQYLGVIALKRPSIWITFSLYWIYTTVLMFIIPFLSGIGPIAIWSNTIINLQSNFIMILGIAMALLVGIIFRKGIEDQSELLIISKPIKRWKINTIKFFWVLIMTSILVIGCSIIIGLTPILGQYDPLNNPKGIAFNKILPLMMAITLASYVIGFLFSSIAIFLSLIATRIQIIITLITINVVFSVYNNVSSLVLENLKSKIESNYPNVAIDSISINTTNSNVQSFAYLTEGNDHYDLYNIYEENRPKINALAQTINFNSQWSNLYSSFNLIDQNDLEQTTEFGYNPKLNTHINQNENLIYFIANYFHHLKNNSTPTDFESLMIFPVYFNIFNGDNNQYDNTKDTGFYHLGLNKKRLSVLKLAGANSQTIYVSNHHLIFDFMPTQFATNNDLSITNQKALDTEIFNQVISKYLNQNDFINITGQHQNKDLILSYVNDLYSLIKINQYGLGFSNEKELNNAIATYKYSVLKTLLYLYWNQILPQYLTDKNITIEQYLSNRKINQVNYFNQFFNYQINKITNPYNNQVINLNLTGSQFIHMILIMSGIAKFNASTYYKTSGVSFIGSTFPLSIDGKFIESIDKRKISNAFVCLALDTNHYDANQIFRYTNHPYLTNVGVSLFWIFISLVLFIGSYVKYQKYDIK